MLNWLRRDCNWLGVWGTLFLLGVICTVLYLTLTHVVQAQTQGASVGDALASIQGKYDKVWGFDATAKTWKLYVPDKASISDLKSLERGQGYWINALQSCTLTYYTDSYSLVVGWNLVGWLGSFVTSGTPSNQASVSQSVIQPSTLLVMSIGGVPESVPTGAIQQAVLSITNPTSQVVSTSVQFVFSRTGSTRLALDAVVLSYTSAQMGAYAPVVMAYLSGSTAKLAGSFPVILLPNSTSTYYIQYQYTSTAVPGAWTFLVQFV